MLENNKSNREDKIKDIIKEILNKKDSILKDLTSSDTVYSLNKFESLVKGFEKYDRRSDESEEIKKSFANKRDSERSEITSYLLQIMKNKITFFENELEITKKIQTKLMPQNIPDIEGYDVYASYSPSSQVGGDYYDFYRTNDGDIFFLISDVSGKGLPSSLTVAGMKAYIKAQVEENKPVVKIIQKLNNYLNEILIPEKFVTMFIGVLKPDKNLITYINAGHNPPIIIKNGNEIIELNDGGTILGMFEDLSFDVGKIQFSDGDILALYTDGITEAFNKDEEEFSLTRFQNIIQTKCSKPLEEISASLFKELGVFCGDIIPHDDITLLLIRKNLLNEYK